MRQAICDLSMRGPLAGVSVWLVAVRIPTPCRRAVPSAVRARVSRTPSVERRLVS